jgi:hypothetical protein
LNYRATNWTYLTLYPTNIKRDKKTCCLRINPSVGERKGRGCAIFDYNGDNHVDDDDDKEDDDENDDDAHTYEDDSNNTLFPSTMP